MCDVIWGALGKVGILRDDPSSWTKTRPEHLQHLKSDPVFRAVGSERTLGAIRQLLEGQMLPLPKDWVRSSCIFPPLANGMYRARAGIWMVTTPASFLRPAEY